MVRSLLLYRCEGPLANFVGVEEEPHTSAAIPEEEPHVRAADADEEPCARPTVVEEKPHAPPPPLSASHA